MRVGDYIRSVLVVILHIHVYRNLKTYIKNVLDVEYIVKIVTNHFLNCLLWVMNAFSRHNRNPRLELS